MSEPVLYADAYATTTMSTGQSLFILLVVVLAIVGLAKVYMKAGQEWWKAIIPIYNLYILLKIVNRPGWWLILFFIPIVNFVVSIIVYNDLSKAFGHGVGFTLGLIFLNFIFLLILAFDKSEYKLATAEVKPAEAAAPEATEAAPTKDPTPDLNSN